MVFKNYLLLLCLIGSFYKGLAQINEVSILALPNKNIVPVFTADMRANKFSVFYHSSNKAEFIGSIGGIIPVADINYKKFKSQFSVGASLYTTLLRSIDAGDVINTDFFVDLYYDIQLNKNFALRTGMGHTSQHLSDDALNKNLYPNSINYVKDYYQFGLTYKNKAANLLVYSVWYYNHNFKTSDSIGAYNLSGNSLWQTGFEFEPIKLSTNSRLFVAGDVKFRAEHQFGSSRNMQMGVKVNGNNNRKMRAVINFTGGFEERGQFYKLERNFISGGLIFEI